jgi:hypothetical protein
LSEQIERGEDDEEAGRQALASRSFDVSAAREKHKLTIAVKGIETVVREAHRRSLHRQPFYVASRPITAPPTPNIIGGFMGHVVCLRAHRHVQTRVAKDNW